MNDEEFGCLRLLNLKYRKRDQIIQTFYKIASPQKFDPSSLIFGNFKSLRNILLNRTECTKI